jgi:hypothetical protein
VERIIRFAFFLLVVLEKLWGYVTLLYGFVLLDKSDAACDRNVLSTASL